MLKEESNVSTLTERKKDIYALKTSNHPLCQADEYLAFYPHGEGVSKIFEVLYFEIYHQIPDKKALEKWFDGLIDKGVRAVNDPKDPKKQSVLIFLKKRWSKTF